MTRPVILAAAFAALAGPAFAGPFEAPPAPPPVIVEQSCTLAFDCFYVGLELGIGSGSTEEGIVGGPTRTLDYDGEVYGAFAGYNFQNGATVFGGEVRYLHLNMVDPLSGFEVNSVLDLRGRIGFAAGEDLLVYAAAGFSIADAMAAASFDMDGFNYGVGAEFNLSDSIFLGADLTGRQLEGSQGVFTYEGDVNTATLRAGFRF